VRSRRFRAAVLAGFLGLAACGDDGGGTGAEAPADDEAGEGSGDGRGDAVDLPDECAEPPLTMALEGFGEEPAGSSDFEVTDAVVRRVPILTGVEGTTADPAELAELEARAAESPIALYSLYVADFEIDRSVLEGFGFGEVTPPPGGTVGTITIVAPNEDGLTTGDVVDGDTEIAYEATTTFAPLGLLVASDSRSGRDAYTDVEGQVEVLALTDDVLCLGVDVTLIGLDGEPASSATGTVVAPIVRSSPSFFFT
jgi:hypothetical protein